MISVVIPALNEEAAISPTLEALQDLPGVAEIIVADGGSLDRTTEIARSAGARVVKCERGRGPQLHAGALAAEGEVLWFVHADTRVGPRASERVLETLANPGVVGGTFTLSFDGDARSSRVMNAVQPLAGPLRLYYGDSTIFLRRETYFALGGFRPYPLFEDVDLIAKMRKSGRFARLPEKVVTSCRRFQEKSLLRTFTRWSVLQSLYWMGVAPKTLGRYYAPVRRAGTP
ncbi:MAG: TIGR04283 family arsenosugar biosynthesis glycosyltransferase [Bryobacteraceae bacterium]|nr:TIGR04283 family arsenosugar biosynthesis glycosyltransferase [Bryobacteraceae bacterium]